MPAPGVADMGEDGLELVHGRRVSGAMAVLGHVLVQLEDRREGEGLLELLHAAGVDVVFKAFEMQVQDGRLALSTQCYILDYQVLILKQ